MTARSSLTALIAALTLGGCIVYEVPHDGSGVPDEQPLESSRPGDLAFGWSFAGRSCAQSPEIRWVKIEIPGESLANGGYFACSTGGYDGIRLANFAPGYYGYGLEAIGHGGELLFSASGTVRVDGDVSLGVELLPAAGPNTYAYLRWHFPATWESYDPSCEQAGIDTVEVSIDGAPFLRFRCGEGTLEPGAQTPMLAAGRHTVEIVAFDAWGYDWYASSSILDTYVGMPVAAEYQLQWSVGGTAVSWSLTDGTWAESCYEAGVDLVSVNFQDLQGNVLFSGAGWEFGCEEATGYFTLPPGTYRIFVEATGPWGELYRSNQASPPTVTVTAGYFPESWQAPTVTLYRVF
jgi:hypothetical protein